VALFPTPFVLLYLPSVNDVAYQIKCVAGIVFKKVIELFGFAILSAKVYVGNKN
jgi:hypothetical protein